MLALINTFCACLALPPILTPFTSVYIMCVVVPLISTTLVYNEYEPEIMNRATGKKHTKFNSKVIAYVMCSYGFKFIPTIVIMVSELLSIIQMKIHKFNNFFSTSAIRFWHTACLCHIQQLRYSMYLILKRKISIKIWTHRDALFFIQSFYTLVCQILSGF